MLGPACPLSIVAGAVQLGGLFRGDALLCHAVCRNTFSRSSVCTLYNHKLDTRCPMFILHPVLRWGGDQEPGLGLCYPPLADVPVGNVAEPH